MLALSLGLIGVPMMGGPAQPAQRFGLRFDGIPVLMDGGLILF